MKCTKCGTEITDDALFCTEHGYREGSDRN